jgi:hypothetical protein
MLLVDRTTMMLLYRFNILNNIHKLRMVVVLVLRNWRIIDRLRWTIRTKFSVIHAAYITHIVVIITVHNNYPLPFLEYILLYSQRKNPACTLDMEGDGLPYFCGTQDERFIVYLLQFDQAAVLIRSIGRNIL